MSSSISNNHASSTAATTTQQEHQDDKSHLITESSSLPNALVEESEFVRTFRDCSNCFRMFFGTNILTMGWTYMTMGMILGPAVTFCIAIIEYRSILALLRVKNYFPDRLNLVAFGEVAERILGPKGSWLVDILVILCQGIGCVGYAIFAGKNLEHLTNMDLSYEHCVIISVSTSFIVSLLGTPLFLARLSVFTNIVMFTGVFVIFSQLRFSSSSGDKNKTAAGDDDSSIHYITEPLKIMIGCATLATALGGITVTLDVERTMAHEPGRFHFLMRRMMALAVLILTLVGVLSYAAFRGGTCSVLSLSLEKGSVPRKIAEGVLVVGPSFESVLNSFQMLVIISERLRTAPPGLGLNPDGSTAQFVVMRVIFYGIVLGTSLGVPFYGLIAAVNGALGYGALAFLVPPILELKLLSNVDDDTGFVDRDGFPTREEFEADAREQQQRAAERAVAASSPTAVAAVAAAAADSANLGTPTAIHNAAVNSAGSMGGSGYGSTAAVAHNAGTSFDDVDNNNNDDDQRPAHNMSIASRGSVVSQEQLELAEEDKLTTKRRPELWAILIIGGSMIGCGLFAAIRQIVNEEDGHEKKGC